MSQSSKSKATNRRQAGARQSAIFEQPCHSTEAMTAQNTSATSSSRCRLVFTCLCVSGVLFVLACVYVKLPQLAITVDHIRRATLAENPSRCARCTPQAASAEPTTGAPESLTERVRRFCQDYFRFTNDNDTNAALEGLSVVYSHYQQLLYAVNPKNNRSVLYCSIPKVANTSLKMFLLSLDKVHSGKYTDSTMHNYVYWSMGLPNLLGRKRVNMTSVASAFKVMFVRHPFERLASFFEDKTRRSVGTGQYFYSKYWNKAMKKYRGANNVNTEKDVITFEEFVDLLLSTEPSRYDIHWQLYSHRCEPCIVPYDFVGTLDDLHVMYDALGVADQSQLWENKGPTGDTKKAALAHFSRLPRWKVAKLYGIYALDFAMFGYSADEYFNRTRLGD